MKKILIFGAGKSATCLIDYLCVTCEENNWTLLLCDNDALLAQSKISNCKNTEAIAADINIEAERNYLIKESDIVISMLPPHLHFLVASDCLAHSKNLLTASYVDASIKSLDNLIKQKGLLFLCEMGLDPGIDHMSAMKIINRIKDEGGKITSFQSHCGGLVAPESDDNPWHYKITWNPGNIVMAGSAGALYKSNGQNVELTYQNVFNDCKSVDIPELFSLACYPNRDSISYIDTYGLQGMETFIRTTLRYPSFCRGWNKIVNMGLTNMDDHEEIKDCKTYKDWYELKSQGKEVLLSENKIEFEEQLNYLDLRSSDIIEGEIKNSSLLLQDVLERKLKMQPHDKDMIVMLHEIGYELNSEKRKIRSALIVKGEDEKRTAMAKTVGLPLGIAAKLILQGKIKLTGLHIPVLPEIYNPVLLELEAHQIKFNE
jgi:saccharopine dehydrogenase-like NADP-dependent oxidoreductase